MLCLVRGSAVNHDGRSNGLTAPNGAAQEAVLRAALANARLEPSQVGYVEAHGTGTVLGDPIEVHALAAALGRGRTASNPLLLGSAKTNLGHLESAAGVAGLIKTVLVLQNGHIPPHLHLHSLNAHIPWSDLPLRVPTGGEPWLAEETSLCRGQFVRLQRHQRPCHSRERSRNRPTAADEARRAPVDSVGAH